MATPNYIIQYSLFKYEPPTFWISCSKRDTLEDAIEIAEALLAHDATKGEVGCHQYRIVDATTSEEPEVVWRT